MNEKKYYQQKIMAASIIKELKTLEKNFNKNQEKILSLYQNLEVILINLQKYLDCEVDKNDIIP